MLTIPLYPSSEVRSGASAGSKAISGQEREPWALDARRHFPQAGHMRCSGALTQRSTGGNERWLALYSKKLEGGLVSPPNPDASCVLRTSSWYFALSPSHRPSTAPPVDASLVLGLVAEGDPFKFSSHTE